MRTTLTLERDVADRIADELRHTGRKMKDIVNEALRIGLGMAGKKIQPPPFRVEPHSFGFKPGIDLDRMNQLVDELEAEEVARRIER